MRRADLFPPIEPFATGMLAVDPPHQIYWEQCGNPDGIPALFLHGGPGAGTTPNHRRFFDPRAYRIVVFDQRGAGRSRPLGETALNSTDRLVADIEALRRHLGIERWLVFGGSWGSTLALAYASAHPERALALVLRGIFLGGRDEIEWFVSGLRTVFPEHWRRFAEFVPESERRDLLSAYHRRLIDPDPAVHMPAARSWSSYEASCSTLLPISSGGTATEDQAALSIARLEAHYFVNRLFIEEGALMRCIGRFRHIPATIVQGRYDMICPIVTADALARAWPQAEYVIVPDAGHAAMEPGIRLELVAATERYKSLLAKA
ncbi:MAG: prolyl aminopeptidase [Alphaproteobacteria bacterium]|nr:prolyl aminopeptidase [Alphaproteobacteria bacterium]